MQISQGVLFERELKHLRMTGNGFIVIIDEQGEVSEVHIFIKIGKRLKFY